MSKPVVGAQLYSLREFTKTTEGFAETIKKVADIGYTTVQVSGIGPIDAADIDRICKDNNVTVSCTHIGWPRFQNELDQVIQEHKTYGCNHPAIGGLPKEYFEAGQDGVKKFVDELGPIVEKLKAAGMDFSYHNHSHELVKYDGKTWLAGLYETAPADLLNAEIDTFWIAHGGGDPAQWITDLAGRQPLLHLKDMVMTPEREQRFAPIGEGNLNWSAIMQAAESAAVEYALVEQDNCYGKDPFEEMATSYGNLVEMGWK
ncbi:MAG: sugar phosphate isomerase/epimerase family protein [Phycisphaerae bacterium]